VTLHHLLHGFSARRRLQPFFPSKSLSAALSSIDSASSFFSRRFPSSNLFRRRASETSRPPHLALHLYSADSTSIGLSFREARHYFQAAILGILQGLSELFPISSLGHSILLPAVLGWTIDQNANYFLSFLVTTHLATATVLFCFYWNDWVRVISGILKSIRRAKIAADPGAKLGWLLVAGTVPAGIVGIVCQKQIQSLFMAPSYVAFFLTLNGLLLYGAELLRTRTKAGTGILDGDERLAINISWWQSVRVGMMQVLIAAGILTDGIDDRRRTDGRVGS